MILPRATWGCEGFSHHQISRGVLSPSQTLAPGDPDRIDSMNTSSRKSELPMETKSGPALRSTLKQSRAGPAPAAIQICRNLRFCHSNLPRARNSPHAERHKFRRILRSPDDTSHRVAQYHMTRDFRRRPRSYDSHGVGNGLRRKGPDHVVSRIHQDKAFRPEFFRHRCLVLPKRVLHNRRAEKSGRDGNHDMKFSIQALSPLVPTMT